MVDWRKERREREAWRKRQADEAFARSLIAVRPKPAAVGQMKTPLGRRVAALCDANRMQDAWDACIAEGQAPERYGLHQPIDDEEMEAIRHFVDATSARYKWQWQHGDLAYPPSSCIAFGFVALSLNYRRGPIDDLLGVSTGPFEDGYAGCRQRNEDTCWLNAHHWQRLVIEEARRRYRDGFYADPFAKKPMRRPVAAGRA